MTKDKQITTEDLIFKLSDVLFTKEAEKLITVINKIDSDANFNIDCSVDEFFKMTDQEKLDVFERVNERNKGKSKEKKIEFIIDGERYELRRELKENSIYMAHYKNEVTVISHHELLDKPVSKDLNQFKQDLSEISEMFDKQQFLKETSYRDDPFYNNMVLCRTFQTVSLHISDEVLYLLLKLKSLFELNEQVHIEKCLNTKFEVSKGSFDNKILDFFAKWGKKLSKGHNTELNKLEFNDMDNNAYWLKKDGYLMIVQQSQNTIFSYIVKVETLQIKVWNCAYVDNSDCEYEMKQYSTYRDLMNYIGNPYSYYHFPIEMSGQSYPKSAHYYMDHFDDESESLVYDSTKGFRINSMYSDSMATDVPLLIGVLEYLNKKEEETEND